MIAAVGLIYDHHTFSARRVAHDGFHRGVDRLPCDDPLPAAVARLDIIFLHSQAPPHETFVADALFCARHLDSRRREECNPSASNMGCRRP
jgi:hypothetical protein